MGNEHCLIFQVYCNVSGWLAGASWDSWLNSSPSGRKCSAAATVNEAGRQGVGQEKLERANAARELQQSLHKRGGLCNACGFVLRNLDRAKHIQMCQTGLKPILYSHSHTFINYTHRDTHRNGKKRGKKNVAKLLRLQSNAEP